MSLLIVSNSSMEALRNKGLGYSLDQENPSNVFNDVFIVYPESDRKVNPFDLLRTFIKYLPRYNSRNIKLIRCKGLSIFSAVFLLIAKIRSIPLISYLGSDRKIIDRGRNSNIFKRFLNYFSEFLLLKGSDLVIVPTDYLRRYAIKNGVSEYNIKIVPWRLNPIYLKKNDLKPFSVMPEVLYIGRMEREKQVHFLVEAIPKILVEKPDASFWFIGDGSLKPFLRNRVKDLGVTDNVCFAPFQSAKTIIEFMSLASIVWISMSGFVILEASAQSKPIVAFDVEWHKEFIRTGVNGLLIPNRNIEMLAQSVVYLLKNPEYAQRLGEEARKTLIQNYHPNKILDIETEILRKYFIEKD